MKTGKKKEAVAPVRCSAWLGDGIGAVIVSDRPATEPVSFDSSLGRYFDAMTGKPYPQNHRIAGKSVTKPRNENSESGHAGSRPRQTQAQKCGVVRSCVESPNSDSAHVIAGQRLTCLISNAHRLLKGRYRKSPLWSLVADLTGNGSTTSTQASHAARNA